MNTQCHRCSQSKNFNGQSSTVRKPLFNEFAIGEREKLSPNSVPLKQGTGEIFKAEMT